MCSLVGRDRCGIDARASTRRGAAGKARADCEITNLTKPDRERTGVHGARYWKLGAARVWFNSVPGRPRYNNQNRGNVDAEPGEVSRVCVHTYTA